MINIRRLYLLLIILLHSLYMGGQSLNLPLKGMTMVAPHSPISDTEISNIQKVNSEWVAFVPYGFSRKNNLTKIYYNLEDQWWGEKSEGIETCIKLAHEKGLKIMLKPQVYIHKLWVGDIDFENEEEWQKWEDSYEEYITFYANLAIKYNVEMFCIGTEFKIAAQKRPEFWKRLINDLRKKYNNKIIYSSNWDGYDLVPFWDELDYIGISSYFPLSERNTPSVNELKSSWRPVKKELRRFYAKHLKKIIFTEYGYMSVDGCAGKAWLIEKDIPNRQVNEKAQANAYDALMASHWEEEYWGGGFLWKWFPAGMGHEGYPEKDYTPQNKKAEQIIKKWYGKNN